MVVELKCDASADGALAQIREKKYADIFCRSRYKHKTAPVFSEKKKPGLNFLALIKVS